MNLHWWPSDEHGRACIPEALRAKQANLHGWPRHVDRSARVAEGIRAEEIYLHRWASDEDPRARVAQGFGAGQFDLQRGLRDESDIWPRIRIQRVTPVVNLIAVRPPIPIRVRQKRVGAAL